MTTTRVSSKHQVTIPMPVFDAAGLGVGDRLVVTSDGPGRVLLERARDVVADLAGELTGVYDAGHLGELRDEWR